MLEHGRSSIEENAQGIEALLNGFEVHACGIVNQIVERTAGLFSYLFSSTLESISGELVL